MAEKIRPPRLRISRRIKKNKVFKVKVKFDHPSFTGLAIAAKLGQKTLVVTHTTGNGVVGSTLVIAPKWGKTHVNRYHYDDRRSSTRTSRFDNFKNDKVSEMYIVLVYKETKV